MSFYNVRPLPQGMSNIWKNSVAHAINSSNIFGGDRINVSTGPYGSTISLDVVDDTFQTKYIGDYDVTAEYYPNQIVTVNPNLNYFVPTGVGSGSAIPFGTTAIAPSGSNPIIPINPGLFICVAYVPPSVVNETWLNSVSSQYPSGIPYNVIQSARFPESNVYWPIYPLFNVANETSYTTQYSNTTIVGNQTFWWPLVPTIPLNVCNLPGGGNNMFVAGYISGSANTGWLLHI